MKNPFRRSPLTDANLRRMRELGLVPYTRVLLPLGRKRCIVLLTSDEREYMDTSDGLKVPLVTAHEFAQEYMRCTCEKPGVSPIKKGCPVHGDDYLAALDEPLGTVTVSDGWHNLTPPDPAKEPGPPSAWDGWRCVECREPVLGYEQALGNALCGKCAGTEHDDAGLPEHTTVPRPSIREDEELRGSFHEGQPSVGCMRPVIERRDATPDGLDRRYTCANCDRPRIEHVEGKRVDPKDDSRTYGVWCGKGLDTRWLVKSWDTCANCNRPKIEHTPTNSYCPGVGQSLGPNPGWNTWLAKSWD